MHRVWRCHVTLSNCPTVTLPGQRVHQLTTPSGSSVVKKQNACVCDQDRPWHEAAASSCCRSSHLSNCSAVNGEPAGAFCIPAADGTHVADIAGLEEDDSQPMEGENAWAGEVAHAGIVRGAISPRHPGNSASNASTTALFSHSRRASRVTASPPWWRSS